MTDPRYPIGRFSLQDDISKDQVKPYKQDLWASLHDALAAPPEFSMTLLASLHGRWVAPLRSIRPEDFSRAYTHPESGRVRLDRNLGLYAWHGRHHTAQITALRERMGWT